MTLNKPSNTVEAATVAPPSTFRSLPAVAAWFGIVTGLLEGVGLLVFQRINWARWAATIHVSEPIIWISALTDLVFFLLVAALIAALAWVIRRLPPLRAAVSVLT